MNLTLQKIKSTVSMSFLKPGDCFEMQGCKYVMLKPHPGIVVVDDSPLPRSLYYVYMSLPGDITPFTMFASDTNFNVIPLGKLVDSDAK